jgi:large subunit ribosomal protein L31e
MGNRKNQRNCENQPEKEVLDTNQNKGIEDRQQVIDEKNPTELTEKEETSELEEHIEENHMKEKDTEIQEEKKLEETEEEAEAEELSSEEKEEKKKEEYEEIVEERTYTIPLGRARIAPRKKRAPKAVRIVKSFIKKHMKIEEKSITAEKEEESEKLVISDEVNKKLWSRGIEKPPRNIRVRAVKYKEGVVKLQLAEGD